MDPARKDCDFQTLQEKRQFKGASQKPKHELGCYFNLNEFLGLVLDGNWEKVEMYIPYLTEIGDNELSRQIYTLMRLHKHCKNLKETLKQEPVEIQSAQTELVNSILSWHHSRYPVAAPRPKFLSLSPDHKCISGQHVSQIAPDMQDYGSASAAPQQRTTHTARRSLGAVTNMIPSNAPVRINYSNTGESASKVQRGRSEIPASVARTLDLSSTIASMDFNPVHSTKLLVGTVAGDIALWEVDSGKMTLRPPQLWDAESLSPELLSAFEEASISVCCVRWNEDGTLFGVAYSKHIIQLFSCPGSDEIVQHKEINAHIGSVNDLVFSSKLLFTCGSDRRIKVWDLAAKFQLVWVIEGCEAPVYSLCPVVRGDIRFLISHSLDGEMKVRRYDRHTACPRCLFRSWKCTTKSYTADSKRLFTSGTDEHGKPYIVEWRVRNGERKVKRAFQGLQGCSGQLHFDLNKNGILAAGYNHQIRFWDIDNGSLLGVSIADGNLPDVPLIKFNQDGNLLAVTTKNNSIKILASVDAMQVLQTTEVTQLPASEIAAKTSSKRSIQKIYNEISPQLFPAKRGRD
ncbi:protein TPR3-like [Apium graveolens]|uniref:protein TPR3-like n=1 Tax=Apium graveolens TaxID=4045 RepID=UPI003D7A0259